MELYIAPLRWCYENFVLFIITIAVFLSIIKIAILIVPTAQYTIIYCWVLGILYINIYVHIANYKTPLSVYITTVQMVMVRYRHGCWIIIRGIIIQLCYIHLYSYVLVYDSIPENKNNIQCNYLYSQHVQIQIIWNNIICVFYVYVSVYVYLFFLEIYIVVLSLSLLYTGNGRVIGAPLRMRRPEDQSPSAASAGLMMEVVRHSI